MKDPISQKSSTTTTIAANIGFEVPVPMVALGMSASQSAAKVHIPVPPPPPPVYDPPPQANVAPNSTGHPAQTSPPPLPPSIQPGSQTQGRGEDHDRGQGGSQPDICVSCLVCYGGLCFGDGPLGLLLVAAVCLLIACFINLFALCTVRWFHESMTTKRRNIDIISIVIGSIINASVILAKVLGS